MATERQVPARRLDRRLQDDEALLPEDPAPRRRRREPEDELDDEPGTRPRRYRSDAGLTDRRSLAKAGNITTAQDLAELMTALMYDVLAGTVTPGEASAVINAGRQTLRLVELSLRYEVSGATPLMSIAERAGTRR